MFWRGLNAKRFSILIYLFPNPCATPSSSSSYTSGGRANRRRTHLLFLAISRGNCFNLHLSIPSLLVAPVFFESFHVLIKHYFRLLCLLPFLEGERCPNAIPRSPRPIISLWYAFWSSPNSFWFQLLDLLGRSWWSTCEFLYPLSSDHFLSWKWCFCGVFILFLLLL